MLVEVRQAANGTLRLAVVAFALGTVAAVRTTEGLSSRSSPSLLLGAGGLGFTFAFGPYAGRMAVTTGRGRCLVEASALARLRNAVNEARFDLPAGGLTSPRSGRARDAPAAGAVITVPTPSGRVDVASATALLGVGSPESESAVGALTDFPTIAFSHATAR